MTKPILYLDHDVHLYFVAALGRHGYEAHSTQECGNERLPDGEQLTFAADRGWTLLSYNTGDFYNLHGKWMKQGKAHAGVLLAAQFNPAQTLRRLLNLLFLTVPDDLHNRILFLGSWLDV